MAAHDALIAAAARRALSPLGLRRRGKSRLWVGDHGWWLAVVEFQPSGLRPGSHLNVAAHWLWSEGGFISFDLGGPVGVRVGGFEEYADVAQFAAAAERLAATAAHEVAALQGRLPDIAAAAAELNKQEAGMRREARGSWTAYHAGFAAALAGRPADARSLLASVKDERVRPSASRAAALVDDSGGSAALAGELIRAQRSALRLDDRRISLV